MDYETIYGTVVAKANHYQAVPDKDGQRRIIKDERIREYERSFASQCRIYRGRNINKPFTLHASIFYPSRAFDLDNGIKSVLDCLQYAHAFTNDNLCYEIKATKHLDPDRPRVTFALEEWQPRLF